MRHLLASRPRKRNSTNHASGRPGAPGQDSRRPAAPVAAASLRLALSGALNEGRDPRGIQGRAGTAALLQVGADNDPVGGLQALFDPASGDAAAQEQRCRGHGGADGARLLQVGRPAGAGARDDQGIGQTATDNSWFNYPAAVSSTVSYIANPANQYTAVGAVTPTYNPNGNLTGDGTFTFGYDAENRLTRRPDQAGGTDSYRYDARGALVQRTMAGQWRIKA